MTTSPSTSTDEVCLDKLRPYLSTQNFDWIKRDDEERNRLKQQIADECPGGHLFADAEDEDEPPRVQEWTSSRSNVDGHGGYDQRKKDGSPVSEEDDGDTVTVVFLLSESYEGVSVWTRFSWISSHNLPSSGTLCGKYLDTLVSWTSADDVFCKGFLEICR